jgi:hypothetical protein
MKKQILLLDSLGALMTAIVLLLIPKFEQHLGISSSLTLKLVPLPLVFSIYSFFIL